MVGGHISGTQAAARRRTSDRGEIGRPCRNVGACRETFFESGHPCVPKSRLLASLWFCLAPCVAATQDFASVSLLDFTVLRTAFVEKRLIFL